MLKTDAANRVAVITGASKGIGLAIAIAFAGQGYKIIICSRNEQNLEQAKAAILVKHPDALVKTFTANMGNTAEVLGFADYCLSEGRIEILVNNAGIYIPGNLTDEAEGNMEQTMNINFFSAYHLTRKLLPNIKAAGTGHIFNISSIAGLTAYDGGGSYSVSKFALTGFSKNLRHELKQTGIKVTTVFPGAVMTDSWAGFDNSNNRIMKAEDIAKMVLAASQLSPQAAVEEIVIRPQLGDL